MLEPEDALAFAVVIKAIACLNFEIGGIVTQGVKLDFLILLGVECGLLANLSISERGLKLQVFPILRDRGGDDEESKGDGGGEAQYAVAALDEACRCLKAGNFFRCEFRLSHISVRY